MNLLSNSRHSTLIGFVCALSLAGTNQSASAGSFIYDLQGTGLGMPSNSRQDANWNVVALPQFFQNPTVAYPAWIPTGGSAPANIPNNWLGGSGNAGTQGWKWVGIQENNVSALQPSGVQDQYYSMIYSTTFMASQTGVASISLDIAVDNRASVFVGGNVDFTNGDKPTIQGGQQVGSLIWNLGSNGYPTGTDASKRGFNQLQRASGNVNVVAGLNTLYIVVDDYITTGTTFGFTGLMVVPDPALTAVPEPESFAAFSLLAAGATTWIVRRRQKKQD